MEKVRIIFRGNESLKTGTQTAPGEVVVRAADLDRATQMKLIRFLMA